jgi:hypothetical protein
MPLPLIIPIIAGVAGAFGVGKGVKAVMDSNEANETNSTARGLVSSRKKKLEKHKEATNAKLAEYGMRKVEALTKNVEKFVTLFQQLKDVAIVESAELENLHIGKFTEVTVGELRHTCEIASSVLSGMASGSAAGTLTAFGAYGGTMAFATAGTGTAIGTLSGAAATNATLAWLGGGTLTSGGLGVAGGTMVLGALVAGPALAIFGSVLGAKASAKLDEAKANMGKAQAFATEIAGVCQKLSMIEEVATVAMDTLSKLRTKLRRANDALKNIIESSGVNFKIYGEEEKAIVLQGVKYVQLIKAMVDADLLSESGEMRPEFQARIAEVNAAI